MPEPAQVQIRAAPSPLSWARDVASLAKPRLSALVVCTAAGGMWLAPGSINAARAVVMLAGTALVVGAANALNNYLEADLDARMRRTRNRPLPAGRLEPAVALAVGLALPAFALPALALAVNPLTALLALVALLSYAGVYTPLKQRTTAALFVGAVPGAIPPLMGWTAVTGRIDWGGLALFGILFLWQLPHFLAVSVYLKEDYARAGHRVFALVHGERAARAWAAAASLLLVPVTVSLVPLGLARPAYGAAAAILGLGLSGWALSGLRLPEGSTRQARSFFLGTLIHLTLLFAALFLWAR
ncbi:MAG TPA: heme o synthase [Anaeromyxobacteraceae bacterium]|nr:heme o synthase [Anaeromyxobacteraceae bacterium]